MLRDKIAHEVLSLPREAGPQRGRDNCAGKITRYRKSTNVLYEPSRAQQHLFQDCGKVEIMNSIKENAALVVAINSLFSF